MTEERYFGVSIETWGEGPSAIDDERLEQLDWALRELGAAAPAIAVGGIGGGPGAMFGVSVPELQADPSAAWVTVTERAIRVFDDACVKAGISHGGIAHVEIMTEEYLDREVDQEPETYLGVTEVARELHVSRQRVSELRRSEAFPAPIAELAAGPVWKGSSLRRFIESWERRPGRPRKDPGGPTEEPPPFQPDPDLIAYLEHAGKPSEAEVQGKAKRAESRSTTE